MAELRSLDILATEVDMVALNAHAVRTSVELVERVAAADLARLTPCSAWTLYGLLAHMTTQHHGFAAASRGQGDMALWKLRSLADDHVETYRAAAEHVLTAYTADGVHDRKFTLPELTNQIQFSAAQAISFHFIDYVVHSWDVARTLGTTVEFKPDLLEVALTVAKAAPGGAARLAPGAAFTPVVPWSGGSRLDEIVAILGRSPTWPDHEPVQS